MRILFVIDTYDTNNNGTSISAQRFAAELRRRGHEVKILTSGEPGEDRFALPTYRMPLFQPLMDKHNFNFAYNEKKTIREAVEWADIIHCFLPFAIEVEAKRYADKIGKPSTSAFHIQPQNLWSSVGLGKVNWIQNGTYRSFRTFLYNKFRHIHAPSQFMADEIKQRGYTAKIHIISNGIQDAFLETGHLVHQQGRPAKSPEFEGKIPIIMIGRLSQEKRQDVIINSVKYSKYADKIQQVSATPQFALDGRSLFKAGSPKDLARAIDYWLDHPNEREYVGELYRVAAKKYSLANSVRMFVEMLNEEIEDNAKLSAHA